MSAIAAAPPRIRRGGRFAEVKAAAGHASLLTTSVYLHVAVEDEGMVGDLFCFAK